MLDICNISKTGRKRTYTSRSSPEDTTQTTDEPSKRVRRAASGTLHTEVRVIDIDPDVKDRVSLVVVLLVAMLLVAMLLVVMLLVAVLLMAVLHNLT